MDCQCFSVVGAVRYSLFTAPNCKARENHLYIVPSLPLCQQSKAAGNSVQLSVDSVDYSVRLLMIYFATRCPMCIYRFSFCINVLKEVTECRDMLVLYLFITPVNVCLSVSR